LSLLQSSLKSNHGQAIAELEYAGLVEAWMFNKRREDVAVFSKS
jgi:hypothetical protein